MASSRHCLLGPSCSSPSSAHFATFDLFSAKKAKFGKVNRNEKQNIYTFLTLFASSSTRSFTLANWFLFSFLLTLSFCLQITTLECCESLWLKYEVTLTERAASAVRSVDRRNERVLRQRTGVIVNDGRAVRLTFDLDRTRFIRRLLQLRLAHISELGSAARTFVHRLFDTFVALVSRFPRHFVFLFQSTTSVGKPSAHLDSIAFTKKSENRLSRWNG